MQLFNENRLDLIWPEDFTEFQRTVWLQDPQYADVRRYGGILLVKPLIAQFGVPRALAYVAQTPLKCGRAVCVWRLCAISSKHDKC
ncbi:MAG: hypothetical protein ABW034_20375 [Steroidobacteraceae bacterium]